MSIINILYYTVSKKKDAMSYLSIINPYKQVYRVVRLRIDRG